MQHIYLIGPGGVGKTTVGPNVAAALGRPFVDLDHEFCRRLDNIGVFLRTRGYADYVWANSKLFATLLSEQYSPVVMALSSGFLSPGNSPEIVAKNLALTTATGTSVLLLPSSNIQQGVATIVARQMVRGFGLKAEPERQKFIRRAAEYIEIADHRINSVNDPVLIAQAVIQALSAEAPFSFNIQQGETAPN